MARWHWIIRDDSGRELRKSQGWEIRDEAEAWLGSTWRDLLEEGGESVSLMEGGREVYTMGLRSE